MSVVVYPRLAELLEARHLTVAELERQIRDRYGLAVNLKTLYRLTQATPVQRADLEIAGATAAILGVGLDDLFTVNAVATDEQSEVDLRILGPEDSRRMATLIDLQAQRLLTEREWDELETLVTKYGQLLHERRLRVRARQHGVSLEQERQDSEAYLTEALKHWRAEGETAQQALVDQ